VAVRKSSIKREIGPALYKVMEPGDRVIAGTWAVAGPGPWLDLLGCVPFFAFGTVGLVTGASPDPFWLMTPWAILLGLLFWRKPVFIAVTERQLICYRLSRTANKPLRPWFCAPLLTVRVTFLNCSLSRWTSIRYDGPGVEGRGLRLNLTPSWGRDLDEVLAALHDRGASVAGSRRGPANAGANNESG
jgi:hypothetical protein